MESEQVHEEFDGVYAGCSQASTQYAGDDAFMVIAARYGEVLNDTNSISSSDKYVDDPDVILNYQSSPPVTSLKRKRESSERCAQIPEPRDLKQVKTFDSEPQHTVPHNNASVIVRCLRIEEWMRNFKLARGVRYEIARLISNNEIEQSSVTPGKLKQLQGSNEEAVPKIVRVFSLKNTESATDDTAFAKEHAALCPWKELDIEDAALAEGPYEGLGNNPARPNWYGGKVQFCGRLQVDQGNPKQPPKVVLQPATLGPSRRFHRRFGSWSFIRINIPKKLDGNKSEENDWVAYFSRPFIIWNAVFRACYAKERNVHLYMTNEIYQSEHTIEGRLSVEGFIIWHNPLLENRNQLMTKWSSRMALGFSESVPGPRLEEGSILSEPDIVSAENSDMTDGCGLSTRKIHHEILLQLGLSVFPSAFQFRVAGCKGMSLLSEDPQFVNNRNIWVRPSQTKIRYPPGVPADPAMLTIDLLRTPHMRSGIRLSNDMVINLAENGVPHKVFARLFRTGLDELVKTLTTWEGPGAMFNLWCAVEKLGGVLAGRRAREAVGEARVRGYSDWSSEEKEEESDDDEDESSPKSAAWWADEISGCPSSLQDTILVLLDSGFRPQDCHILRNKLKNFMTSKIKNRFNKIGFEIEQSCIAFAVPDPYGVLGENEVQIKSSSRNLKLEDGTLTDIIIGDVLIGRNPTKNPCDIRKVRAVEHPQLRNFVDVIVCSIKGFRRLIDFLAGGDYDGDLLIAIWLASIVSTFKNADEKYSKEPPGLHVCFERDEESVGVFFERTESWTTEKRTEAMQVYLLGGLRHSYLIGTYSKMHEFATYTLGYSHPKTIKLNAKFNLILDSSKNGLRIRDTTLKADKINYRRPVGPEWEKAIATAIGTDKKTQTADKSNQIPYKRNHSELPPFVMDTLAGVVKAECSRVITNMDEVLAKFDDRRPDRHLIQPWLDAEAWARQAEHQQKELDLIAAHVRNMYDKYDAKKIKTPSRTERRQDILREISQEFQNGPPRDLLPTFMDDTQISRIRASYAYKYDSERAPLALRRFPWDVDLRQLCAIKAAALGPYKVVTTNFYDQFKLTKRN